MVLVKKSLLLLSMLLKEMLMLYIIARSMLVICHARPELSDEG